MWIKTERRRLNRNSSIRHLKIVFLFTLIKTSMDIMVEWLTHIKWCQNVSLKSCFFFLVQGLRKCWLLQQNGQKHCTPSQKPFCPFWGPKIKCLNIYNFQFSCWQVFINLKEDICKFSKTKLILKVPAFFWKGKLCRTCAKHTLRNMMIFWSWTHKNKPDRQQYVLVQLYIFENGY